MKLDTRKPEDGAQALLQAIIMPYPSYDAVKGLSLIKIEIKEISLQGRGENDGGIGLPELLNLVD